MPSLFLTLNKPSPFPKYGINQFALGSSVQHLYILKFPNAHESDGTQYRFNSIFNFNNLLGPFIFTIVISMFKQHLMVKLVVYLKPRVLTHQDQK